MPDTSNSPRRRLVFLDLLRLVAIFQMLQGHTLDAVLDTHVRTGDWHAAWTSLRGLTSVAFLFLSGFTSAIVLCADYPRERGDRARAGARVRRAFGLVALGYALHLPLAALSVGALSAALRDGSVVDILQCIGVSLLAIECVARGCRTPQAFGIAAAFVAAGCLALAPLSAQLAVVSPVPVAGYLGPVNGALFPLLPWSAHVFVGAIAGAWLRPTAPGLGRRLLAFAACLWVLARLALGLSAALTVTDHLHRIAVVVAVAGSLAALSEGRRSLPPALSRIASSSLRIYVAHVLVLYADGLGLSTRPGPTLGWPLALLTTVLIMALSAALALVPALRHRVVAGLARTG